MVVRSSYPDPADAKLTPVRLSSSDSYGSRKRGTVSLIPRMEAAKSEIIFPSENLPVATWPRKYFPYGGWLLFIIVFI